MTAAANAAPFPVGPMAGAASAQTRTSRRSRPTLPRRQKRPSGNQTQPADAPEGATIEALITSAEAADSASGEELKSLIARITANGCALTMAQDPNGTRALQLLLEVASDHQRCELIIGLQGHVWKAIESPHANHVLQRSIELLRPSSVGFILTELISERPTTVARHRFGCRVLERLIEHFPLDQLEHLLDGEYGILMPSEVAELCKHNFGNFVMQHLLEHGDRRVRCRIHDVLCSDLATFAMDKHACGVLDKALSYGDLQDCQELARRVTYVPGLLARLAECRGGSATAALLRLFRVLDGAALEEARSQISQSQVLHTKYGQSICKAAGLSPADVGSDFIYSSVSSRVTSVVNEFDRACPPG